MNFKPLFKFLTELQQNNHKAWMDEHRSRYRELRNSFIAWLDALDLQLSQLDPDYYPTPGKRGINRINNNLMFHPDKPVYKDHFGGGLDKAPGTADFYIEIGLSTPMLAGGLWRPQKDALNSVRGAIDYNGEELLRILEAPKFKKRFGGLYPDRKLQRTPKGFLSDHPHAELLKNISFAVTYPLTRKQILSPDFEDILLEVYWEMLPFRRYLNQALTVSDHE